MFTSSKLTKSIRLAMAFGAMSTAITAGSALAQEAEESGEKFEKIEITGSRIQRTDMEGALPVSIISREDIEASGDVSLGEVLRNFPGNSQGSFTPRSGSSAQTTSDIDLRGLGSDRTLVLLDGRRVPSDALGGGAGQNLNLVPLAAVERIEILREGASAIYGSEAIGGVINIILRKNYDGLQASVKVGRPSRDGGGDEETYSLVGGVSSEKGNITFAIEHRENTRLFANERDITAADLESGVGYSTNSDPANYRVTDFFGDGTNVLGFWRPDPSCDPDVILVTPNITRTNPTTGEVVTGENRECRFPFANVASWLPSFKNSSFFVTANYEITEDLSVFSQATFTRLESLANYAPIPLVAGFGLTVAADDPLNPTFGSGNPQEVLTKWRPQALGNRDFEVETVQLDFQVGFDWHTDWGILSGSAQVGKQDSSDITRNLVLFNAIFDQIEAGAINPFGTPEQVAAAADTIRADSFREAELDLEVYNVNWSGEVGIGDFLAGDVSYAVGFEFRSEDFAETFDPLTRTGAIFGSVGGPSGGGRDSRSYYFEAAFPILDTLEFTYAGRQDEFSLPDSSDYTQSARFRWEATDDIVARLSYTEGFRVPNIDTLLQEGGESTDQAVDRLRCNQVGNDQSNPLCQTGEIQALRRPGSNTQPEFSETISLGVAWNVTENFNVTLDWYQTEIKDQINFLSTQEVLDLEATGVDPATFNVDVRRDGQGEIVEVVNGWANLPGFETDGIDMNLQYFLRETGAGDFRVTWDLFWVLSFDAEAAPGLGVFDNVGFQETPEFRSKLALDWMYEDFNANLTFNHTDGFDSRTPEDVFLNGVGEDVGALPSYTTIDASVTYSAPWGSSLTIGARNLTDKISEPNNHAYGNRVYSLGLGDILGRVVYFNFKHDF